MTVTETEPGCLAERAYGSAPASWSAGSPLPLSQPDRRPNGSATRLRFRSQAVFGRRRLLGYDTTDITMTLKMDRRKAQLGNEGRAERSERPSAVCALCLHRPFGPVRPFACALFSGKGDRTPVPPSASANAIVSVRSGAIARRRGHPVRPFAGRSRGCRGRCEGC